MARNCSPLSMALIRAQLQGDLQTDFATALAGTYRAMSYAVTEPDFREGIDSYMQKRPPGFAPLAADFDPRAVIGAPTRELDFDPGQPA